MRLSGCGLRGRSSHQGTKGILGKSTVALSVKIIYLIHCQMRMNHFKFWVLSSIEWRINEMMVQIKQLKK